MWYAIEGHDGPDVLAQRLAARPEHLARLTALRDDGRLLARSLQHPDADADLAVARKTGARGLRAILEDVLGPIMFEIPSTEDVAKVIVTRAAVTEGAPPTLVLERKRKSA